MEIETYLSRPRMDKLLDSAIRYDLVYVVAGAGYGKTQTVHRYLKPRENCVIRWIQLSESDNVVSHFWENITHNVSFDNPELAARLRDLGFPETSSRFKQFTDILKKMEHSLPEVFLVLDDFHNIHDPDVLVFAERCATLHLPNSCVIIISRKEPDINSVSMFAKGEAIIISEDELRFTEGETIEFLKQHGIKVSAKDIPKIVDSTKGWILALNLLALVLKRKPDDLDHALEATRQNLFKLLEFEAYADFPEDIRRRLVQLSLTPNLPLLPLSESLYDDLFIQYAQQLSPFIWYDSFISDYRIHPVYLEFLQSKQHILSDEEKHEIYMRVSKWCFENDFYTDAIKYCAITGQYGRMLEVLISYPFRMPERTGEFFLSIIRDIDPDDKEEDDLSLLALKSLFIPILLMGTNKFKEAEDYSFATISKWENVKTPAAYVLLAIAYSNLSYISLYTGTLTGDYDFPKYLKMSLEYQKLSGIPPAVGSGAFLVADIRSFACIPGEKAKLSDFEQYIEKTRENAIYIAETPHGMYHGYEDLAACEFEYFKNNLAEARSFAHSAILKALEHGQYSIASMANGYLLRLAIIEGDYPLSKEIMKQMEKYPGADVFWNRHLLYDLFTGFFYAQIGLPEMAASWLIIDNKETESEVRIRVRELIVSAKCCIASQKFKQALTILSNSYPREPMHRFRLGELTLTLLLSLTRLKTGDVDGAMSDFEKAYTLSYDGVFEMPFIELGKNFQALATAAVKHEGCMVPKSWLTSTGRKASAYTKKAAVITASIKKEMKIKDDVKLSDREYEILQDLYHGLSRDEMAATRYLSVNTVNKILHSLFMKLDANNNIDVIRIALDKSLL